MRSVLFALLLVAAGAGLARAADGWISFTDPERHFRVELTGEPIVTTARHHSLIGFPYTETIYTTEGPGYRLSVTDEDLSWVEGNGERALEDEISNIEKVPGTNVTLDDQRIEDHREVIVLLGRYKSGGTFEHRLFFEAQHLYTVTVTKLPGAGPEVDDIGRRFLGSFHFTP